MPAAGHVQRQIAVAAVVSVKEPSLLLAVQRIVSSVKIERDLLGRPRVHLQDQVDEEILMRPSGRRRAPHDLADRRVPRRGQQPPSASFTSVPVLSLALFTCRCRPRRNS